VAHRRHGITFGGETEPGVDVILPDIGFLEAERPNLKALLLTMPMRIILAPWRSLAEAWRRARYATPFTAAMLKSKLGEAGFCRTFRFMSFHWDTAVTIGPFDIELVNMSHSIPEPSAVIIKTDLGTVFHTADWKLDEHPLTSAPTDVRASRRWERRASPALICELDQCHP